mgnify:CR=1 FL=1
MGLTVKVKRRKLYLTGLPDALAKEQMRHAKKAVELYETSVEGWQEAPKFDVKPLRWDGLSLNIYARGDINLVKRYIWIDGGFERKVHMEDDFMAKSTPGILRQGGGRGGVKHGIAPNGKAALVMLKVPVQTEPRRFTKSVADAIRNDYFEGMRKVLRRYLKNRGR